MDIGANFRISAGVDGQRELDRLNASVRQTGQAGEASAGQIKAAMRSLPAQFTDIAVSLQGGQSPLTVLFQQGGQIRDMFGSFGAAARGVGSLLASMITPTTLVIGAIAGLGAVLAKGALEAGEFRDKMLLSGNAAGMTMGRFEALSERVKDAAGVSAGAARELAAAVAGTGVFGPQTIGPATEAMARIQKLSGQSADQIAKDFAGMRSGVASWAAEHNRQYNYLTAAQYAYIKGLE